MSAESKLSGIIGAVGPVVVGIALCASTHVASAQNVFLCESEGRSFAVSGPAGPPPGCRVITDPGQELLLAPAQPDIEALSLQVELLSERISRLEAALLQPSPRARTLAPTIGRSDPFDTRGRTRDLGQDIERRLGR